MQLPYRQVVRIKKCEELQFDLEQACLDYGGQFYQETLDEWYGNAAYLRGTEWAQGRVLKFQESRREVESRLPNIDDSEFDRYCLVNDLLARLLEGP